MKRRDFLKSSAAGITLLSFRLPARGEPMQSFSPNAFLAIGSDGSIIVTVCQAEMGQGIGTGLAMALAEELRVPLARVSYRLGAGRDEYHNRALSPDEQITGGSRSMQAFFDVYRRAGAQARALLTVAAAGRWRVPPAQCEVRDGRVHHPASGRNAGFAQLAARAARLRPATDAALTDPSQFRLIGTPAPRIDTREKCDGSAVFGIDVRLPGMVHAAVRHSPVRGAEVRRYEAGLARSVPGVINVAVLPGAVAVIADHYWQAAKALELVEVEFTRTPADIASSAAVDTALQAALAFEDAAVALDTAGAADKIAGAARRVTAQYQVPYLAHATLEPINATADVRDARCDIWAPTQAPTRARSAAARALDIAPDRVAVHPTHVGGGFGIKGRTDVVVQAALLSRMVHRPVKVIWSREEDMRQDYYRPAYAASLIAALGEDGLPQALQVRLAGSGPLVHARPDRVTDGIDPISVRDLVDLWYAIGSRRVESIEIEPPVRVGFWRGTGATQNVFFVESFMDEIAQASGLDPLDLRRRLLAHDLRSLAVLDLAAGQAGWHAPAAPELRRGIAFFASPRWKCRVALVAEIAPAGERWRPVRMVCAVDVGLAVNPAIVRDQIAGGIVYGLSAALYGEITIERGAVQQSNFDDYPVLRMAQAPLIEVHLVEGDREPGSVGEIGVPTVAPALANALFAATGARVRRLPIAALAG